MLVPGAHFLPRCVPKSLSSRKSPEPPKYPNTAYTFKTVITQSTIKITKLTYISDQIAKRLRSLKMTQIILFPILPEGEVQKNEVGGNMTFAIRRRTPSKALISIFHFKNTPKRA